MRVSERAPEVLQRLEQTRWHYYNLHPQSAELLALLARLARAQLVIEVGTANGYSAIVLGAAVSEHGGRVVTIERDGTLVEEAKRNITEAGLKEVVTVLPGSAYKVLRDLEGPWDFAFLDATKQEYQGYLERILPKLAPSAVLVADNLLSHADELREFVAAVASHSQIQSTVLPIGTGLLVGVVEQPLERLTNAPPVAAQSAVRAHESR